MASAFVASPLLARPRHRRARTDTSRRLAPLQLAKRPKSKRSSSNARGFSGASSTGKSDAKRKDSGKSEPLRDISPAPPVLSEAPDAATLRAEFAKRGIEAPPSDAPKRQRADDSFEEAADADSGTMPEIVAARMGRRMILFGGVPISLLFAFFAAYFVLTYRFDIRVLPGVVAYSTLSLIGAAGIGITYGIFSTSWDIDDEGSRLGFEEARVNFFRTRDALAGASRKEKQEDQFEEFDRIAQDATKTDEE